MNTHVKSIVALAGALCVLPLGSAHAEDNTTNIISGTTIDYAAGIYIFGDTGTNNYLQIDSGGKLINCARTFIGNGAGASNNTALVTGSGSAWDVGALTFGWSGNNNLLKIANGGAVNGIGAGNPILEGVGTIMGFSWAPSSGNILVTDSGSSFNVGGGILMEGNSSLTVSNGATVGGIGGYGTYLIGADIGYAGNNKVLVTGAGSTFIAGGNLFLLGDGAGNNTLTIADGGLFDSPSTAVAIDFFSGNNQALVTGAGSAINVGTQPFYVGYGLSGSSLVVSNGGAVITTGSIFQGVTAGASTNTITITGPGSILDNQLGYNPVWLGYDAAATGNILNVGNGGLLKTFVVVATGTNGMFNLGDGTTPATANLYYVELRHATARMNINAGVLQPVLAMANMIWGPGAANNVYIQSGGLVADCSFFNAGIQIPLREDPSSTGGGLTKIGANTFTLGGANTYTGATTVSNGTLQVHGSLPSSTVTLASGTTLGGSGFIGTPVTVPSGTTLQPGGSGDITNLTATLTISNTLTLAGTTVMVLNRTNAQTSSMISGITTLTQGGTLTVTNVGDALQAGDAFSLFSASSVSAAFTATNLPSLDAGLTWNFNGRILKVMGNVDPTPTNIVYGVSGSILTLTWPGSHLGWYAQSNSVNVASPSSWFDIAGSQTVTNLSITISPALPQVFYRLRYP